MVLEDLKEDLSKINGRETFLARVSNFGTAKKTNIKTICLENVRLEKNGEEVASHVWLVCANAFDKPGLKRGTNISFRAKVVTYIKGTYQEKFGYGLNFPSHVQILGKK
ncbi:MAG: hypothetical protein FWE58_03580 [Methanobrevibacter sp.]|nr:hypothetical protein [Methanobrevibacter sp.]